MKKIILSIYAAAAMLLLPAGVYAFDVSLNIMTPNEGITDVSDMVGPPQGNEVLQAFNYTTEKGVIEYTAVFDVTDATDLSTAPLVLGMGANISGFEYNETTQQFTIIFTTADFFNTQGFDTSSDFMFAFIPTTADPTPDNPNPGNGPPASMAKGFVSTSVADFEITPPAGPEEMGFGLTLNGPAGEEGFFKLYMPPTMLTLMSTMSGRTITVADLAVFVDEQQASISVTETVDGGALFDISVQFAAGSTATSSLAASTVEKKVFAKEKDVLSAALKNSTINKKKKVRIYGWSKNQTKNQKVKILMKKKGENKFTQLRVVKTDQNGKYTHTKRMKKKGTYYFKAKLKKIKSPQLTLIVS